MSGRDADRGLVTRVDGIGLLGPFGRGLESLRSAVAGAPPAGVRRVEMPQVADAALRSRLRRADRLSAMATVAAADALADALADGAAPIDDRTSVGVVVGSGFGPHATTFRFLDDKNVQIVAAASPTAFSHSVHNSAASNISSALELRAQTLTDTQFAFSFHSAVLVAAAWLAEGRCRHVLVGAVEECGDVMERIAAHVVNLPAGGRIRPLTFALHPETSLGEGAAFFLLSAVSDGTPPRYCSLDVEFGDASDAADAARARLDLCLVDADGLAWGESRYVGALPPGVPCASFTPHFGAHFAVSAFHCALGASLIRDRAPCPPVETENPHALPIPDASSAPPRRIACVRVDCDGAIARLDLAHVPETEV